VEGKQGEIHLDASIIMTSMEVSTATATSFLPILARQMEGADSPVMEGVLLWYERFARHTDEDGDGYPERLSYASNDIDENVVTANVAAGRAVISASMMREITEQPSAWLGHGPQLEHIDAELVAVPMAYADGAVLNATIQPAVPGKWVQTQIEVSGLGQTARVWINGAPVEGVIATAEGIQFAAQFKTATALRVEAASASRRAGSRKTGQIEQVGFRAGQVVREKP
jgi:hypothetical protein